MAKGWKEMNMRASWAQCLRVQEELTRLRGVLLRGGKETAALVRESLRQPETRIAALAFASHMPAESLEPLLPTLMTTGLFVHGATELAWNVLAAAPRDVVVRELEVREEQILERRDYEEIACLLQLWCRLGDPGRAERLAQELSGDDDEDVRDAALAFLESRGGVSQ